MTSVKSKPNNHPPPTRVAEYRIIIEIVNTICLEIRKFAKKYLAKKAVEYQQCAAFLDELLQSWGMDASQFASSKEFWEKHKVKEIPSELSEREEHTNLLSICERARNFEQMVPSVRERLVTCVRDHLFKYCRSFSEEAGELDISPIQEYEEATKANRKEIDDKIDVLNNSILKYGDMKSPFRTFIADGSLHAKLMEEICVLIIEIAHCIKKWIADDASYPERLLQEVFFNNSYKEKMMENILKLQEERKTRAKALDVKHKLNYQTMRDHSYHKRDKHKLRNSLYTVNLKLERLDVQIESKNQDIDKLEEDIADKTPIPPRDRQALRSQLEKANDEHARLEERKSVMERQKLRLEKDLKRISDRTYELKVEVVTSRHDQEEMKQGILGTEIEIKSIYERISSIEEKQEVLKRVRAMKLSPDTLRRIHKKKIEHPKKAKEEVIDLENDSLLDDACKFVALHIGRDWKRLYDRLPFIPPREPERRQKDVEVIDTIAARQDKTPEESALRCLEKWRAFNRKGDIAQLIKGLRKLHKVDLAHKLESRYSVENVYG